MEILVVGATGELGTAVVRALWSSGHSVRALIRPGARCAHLVGNGVALVPGDLRDAVSLDAACAGADAVFNTANSVIPRGAYRFEEVEGAGARALIDAARRHGVRHFVFGSVPPTPLRRQGARGEHGLRAAVGGAVPAQQAGDRPDLSASVGRGPAGVPLSPSAPRPSPPPRPAAARRRCRASG